MMLAGLTGFGGTTLPCCYMGHVVMMFISILGCGVFALVIFGQVYILPPLLVVMLQSLPCSMN